MLRAEESKKGEPWDILMLEVGRGREASGKAQEGRERRALTVSQNDGKIRKGQEGPEWGTPMGCGT